MTTTARSRRKNPRLPDTATVRELAARAGCDPRTVEREILEPGAVTGMAGRRVRAVLDESVASHVTRDEGVTAAGRAAP